MTLFRKGVKLTGTSISRLKSYLAKEKKSRYLNVTLLGSHVVVRTHSLLPLELTDEQLEC